MRRLLAVVGTVLLLATGCSAQATPSAPPTAFGWHGIEPPEPLERPAFALRTTDGEAFDFAERTGGRPTFLYFGYTNCPDECPTAMADIAAALRQVPGDLREQVQVVLVTTDPGRDTGPVLRRFLDQFSTDFVGLVGTQAQVDAAQSAAGLSPATKGGPVPTLPGQPDAHVHEPGTAPHTHTGPLGYGVAHANVILAYDVQDRMPVFYPGGVRPADLAADLPELARQP